MQLSTHFSLEEATRSDKARELHIPNQPNAKQLGCMIHTAARMERVRDYLGHPIVVSSFFRCAELNYHVGGSPTSAHVEGLAVDFTCPGFGSVLDVCYALREAPLPFDQLIFEYGRWVHLGFAIDRPLRRQVLTKLAGQPYTPGLPART